MRRPSLPPGLHVSNLCLQDDATFADPLTNAHGRKHYEAQWYSLETAFSEIECLYHSVTSAGNPVTMNLKTRYKIKGIGKDQIISSVVQIYTDGIGERIVRVENRWNDILPEGPFSKVSLLVTSAFFSYAG